MQNTKIKGYKLFIEMIKGKQGYYPQMAAYEAIAIVGLVITLILGAKI